MTPPAVTRIEPYVARCRVVLSLVALLAVYVDPSENGPFSIGLGALTVIGAHLVYSLTLYYLATWRPDTIPALAAVSTWTDVFLGAAIAYFTEAASSPFYAFFAFAVVAVGFRAGFSMTMQVTVVSVLLYLGLILVSSGDGLSLYIMRPVYLGVIGFLVGYLGQRRLNLETEISKLAADEQRIRIARDLHDSCVQALAGINLKLESCEELLRRGQVAAALGGIGTLREGVVREHEELRSYMRSLAGQQMTSTGCPPDRGLRVAVDAQFTGSGAMVEHVLQILRESVTNICRHAQAKSATIAVNQLGGEVVIAVDDDGVGLSDGVRPWSIASRVQEIGGQMKVAEDDNIGAHLSIKLECP
jgi:signal transduction histidine kinase